MNQDNAKPVHLPLRESTILEEFRNTRPVYEKLLHAVRRLLIEEIRENGIYINAFEGRVKTEESLAGKLERKMGKYVSLLDLTDIMGVRIIAFYSDEVDKIAALVGRIFEIDWDNSIDKRKMLDIDRFGYSSLHYICRIPKELYFDPEYPQLNEIRFEVQMRTALQHVWSVLNHDTGYKSGLEIPKEYLRNLNRLAGMLELADEQFCVIRTGINNYRRSVQALVRSGCFEEVALDGDSFANYLEARPFDSLNKRIAAINQAEIHETSLTRFLKVFAFFGFKTLGDIEKMLKDDSEDAYQLAAFQLANTDLDIINSSLAVVSLCAVHVLKQGGGVLELSRFLEALNGVSINNKQLFFFAFGRPLLHTLLELLHLFLVELVEFFELLGIQDFGERLHAVDAVLQEGLVGVEHLGLCIVDACRVAAFEGLPQGFFGFVLLLAQVLEDGVALGAAFVECRLLFGRHLQQGVDDDGVHLVLELVAAMESVVGSRTLVEITRMVRSARGWRRHHALARARAFHFFAAGHFALVAARAAFAAEAAQEESQGQCKYGKACGEQFCSFHGFTP